MKITNYSEFCEAVTKERNELLWIPCEYLSEAGYEVQTMLNRLYWAFTFCDTPKELLEHLCSDAWNYSLTTSSATVKFSQIVKCLQRLAQ